MSSFYTLKIVDGLMFVLPDATCHKYIHSTNNKNNSKAEMKTFRALKTKIGRGKKGVIEAIEWEGGHICNNFYRNMYVFFTMSSWFFRYCIVWCLHLCFKIWRWVLQIMLLISTSLISPHLLLDLQKWKILKAQ